MRNILTRQETNTFSLRDLSVLYFSALANGKLRLKHLAQLSCSSRKF